MTIPTHIRDQVHLDVPNPALSDIRMPESMAGSKPRKTGELPSAKLWLRTPLIRHAPGAGTYDSRRQNMFPGDRPPAKFFCQRRVCACCEGADISDATRQAGLCPRCQNKKPRPETPKKYPAQELSRLICSKVSSGGNGPQGPGGADSPPRRMTPVLPMAPPGCCIAIPATCINGPTGRFGIPHSGQSANFD